MAERGRVEGTVLQVVFQNEENGYAVLRLAEETGELLTLVGCVPGAAPGERLSAYGVWEEHPQHGTQFHAEETECLLPEEEEEIERYLASGAVKGVGPATAEKIVRRFGAETFTVLAEEPERLTCIKGVTAKRAQEIAESFRERMGVRQLMEFLGRYELPVTLSMQLYRRFGASALERVQDNPYLLSTEDCGVAFARSDAIALSLGFAGDCEARVQAAVLFELSHNLNNGHVFLPREKLIAAAAQLIDLDMERTELALDTLIDRHSVIQRRVANVEACYLYRLFEAESFVAEKLRLLLSAAADEGKNVTRILSQVEAEQGVVYAPAQREAVELAAKEGMLLLTGGPGTGKTTAVRGILAVFDRMGLETLLLAPTGRAAKRMGEVCGREAQTIHRCLGMSWNEQTGTTAFLKGEKEPLEADAVIVDEMSMVDLPLMRALLAALKPGTRLVMVGDPDQLPAVGPGNVFADLIRCGRVPVIALREVFRQAEQSAIIRSAHEVNAGVCPDLGNRQGEFFFLTRRDPGRAADTIVELCQTRLPKNMGIAPGEIQVLSPTRKGPAGTEELNRRLQAALNPPEKGKGEVAFGRWVFRLGDRVMQNRNNYDALWQKADGSAGTGVFNGDVGQITEVDEGGEFLVVAFDDRSVVYDTEMLKDLELAYAMTVHKSQGSEYRAVVFAALNAAPSLMVRGVLYTAITRARELLVLVGDDAAVRRMTENDRQQRRYSGLKWRLKNGE
ncbi:MAG: ATP-dependent RecD-like DNA helicase [Oscillospiraceae bacterium]